MRELRRSCCSLPQILLNDRDKNSDVYCNETSDFCELLSAGEVVLTKWVHSDITTRTAVSLVWGDSLKSSSVIQQLNGG